MMSPTNAVTGWCDEGERVIGRRKKSREEASTHPGEVLDRGEALTEGDPGDAQDAGTIAGPSARSAGPFDSGEAIPEPPHGWGRLDLGSVQLLLPDGAEIRLNLDEATKQPMAAAIVDDGRVLEVMAFAAPRTLGIWRDVRKEIAKGVTGSGGTVDQAQGRFGVELLARIPSDSGRVEARFVGVDGPRWFLRGLLSGPGAHDDAASQRLLDAFAGVVVVRDDEARPAQELLPLVMPSAADADDASA
jgi:hypothetical protein